MPDREDAISVSRMNIPTTARMTPITSNRRSGDKLSQKEGEGWVRFCLREVGSERFWLFAGWFFALAFRRFFGVWNNLRKDIRGEWIEVAGLIDF